MLHTDCGTNLNRATIHIQQVNYSHQNELNLFNNHFRRDNNLVSGLVEPESIYISFFSNFRFNPLE